MAVEYKLDWLGTGSGTWDDPYIVKDPETLARIQTESSAHFVQVCDIDMAGVAWEPAHFYGEYDGRGFSVSNLYVDKSGGGHGGCFVNNLNGYVHDLNLNGTIIGTSGNYNGLLCSFLYGRAERICLTGIVNNGGDRGGALTGYISGGDGYIAECISLVDFSVSSGSRSGHVTGWTNGTIRISNFVFTDDLSTYDVNLEGGGESPNVFNAPELSLAQLAVPSNYPPMFEFGSRWELVDGLPRLRARPLPGTVVDVDDVTQSSKVSGVVLIDDAPVKRSVRAFSYYPEVHEIDGEVVTLSKSLGSAQSTQEDGSYILDLLYGYDKPVFVVAFDDYGVDFFPSLDMEVGDRVHPTTPNGHVWECVGQGSLPDTEPEWVIDTETAQVYGSASLIAVPFYRPMVHGPVTPEVSVLSELWTPDLAESVVWLDLSDTASYTVQGGKVSEILDLSGRGLSLSQVNSTYRPTLGEINGIPALVSSGSESMVSDVSVGVDGGAVLISVVASADDYPDDSGDYETLFEILDFTQFSVTHRRISDPQRENLRWAIDSSVRLESDYGSYPQTGTPARVLTLFVIPGVEATIRLNGLQIGRTTDPSKVNPASVTGLLRLFETTNFSSGANWRGKLGELLIENNCDNLATVETREGYLAHKWGTAEFLPTDHPYKGAPPVIESGGTVAFTNRQVLTIDSTNVASDLQDFPFKITEANLDAGFWSIVHPYGDDIAVTDANDNILPIEVVVLDRARQKLVMYATVPVISSTTDTELRIYYGSSDTVQRPSGVWGVEDLAILHLQDPHFEDATGTNFVNVNRVGTSWKRPNLLEEIATSGHIGVHQGVAYDGSHYYLFDTNEIKKMDLSWALVTSNANPVGDLTATTDHLGDGDIHNGILYIPVEVWGGCGSVSGQTIAMFNASDLTYAGEYDISGQGHEVSSLVIEPDDDRVTVTSYCNADRVYQYKLSDMSFIGELMLSSPIDKIQGITRVGDYYYITSDGTEKLVYRARLDGTVEGVILAVPPGNSDNIEGLTYNGSELLILIDMLGTTSTQEVFTYKFVDGALFNGEDPAVSEDYPYLEVPLAAPPTTGTMSVWFSPADKVQRAIVSFSDSDPGASNERCSISIDDGTNLGTWDSNGQSWLYTGVNPTVGELHGAFLRFASGGSRTIGHNGQGLGTGSAGTISIDRDTLYIGIEDWDTNEGFNGLIQEVRFRGSELSNEWLAFEDLNIRTPGATYTIGSEESGDFSVAVIE